MKELLQKKLSDSAAARWTALLAVSFTMMCGYFFTDVMSPLEPMLTSNDVNGLGWTSDEYGFFSGAYGYFNVFLLLLFSEESYSTNSASALPVWHRHF